MKNVTEENLENPAPGQNEANFSEPELTDANVEQLDPVAKLEADFSAVQDKYLRLVAEFDNYKKRITRERIDLLKSASSEMMLAILPVLDDFERAVKAGNDAGQPLAEGVLLIFNKMKSALDAKGLKAMETVGKPFDADLHDAIAQVPAPTEQSKGNVLEEVTKGYYLGDKVLRHAKVLVAI